MPQNHNHKAPPPHYPQGQIGRNHHHGQPPPHNHHNQAQPPPHPQPQPQQQRPPQQPPNYYQHQQPPPYRRRPPQKGRTNFASCIVATVFLVFLVIVVLIVFFTMFRPKDPEISVASIQLPSFSITNSTVSFTFSQYASVRNPNRAVFTHYDSSLQLLYSGNQVGFMFIPAGKIAATHTQYMAATFAVQSFPLAAPLSPASVTVGSSAAEVEPGMAPIVTGGGIGGSIPGSFGGGNGNGVGVGGGYRMGPTLEIESRLELKGRVRVLHFFTHHAKTTADCRVTVAATDGSVLGFHC